MARTAIMKWLSKVAGGKAVALRILGGGGMFGERLSHLPEVRSDRSAVIQILRPQTEVVTAELDVLKEEVRHFDPHLVICSLPATAGYGDIVCWGGAFPWGALPRGGRWSSIDARS